MTPEQRAQALRAGEQAAEFYEAHPFEAARQQIVTAWTKAQTPEARESLWHELQALGRVVGYLTSQGQNAKAAAIEIKLEQPAGKVDPYENA